MEYMGDVCGAIMWWKPSGLSRVEMNAQRP